MNLLITAGNTQSPIDRVRCITNIFSGRTGAQVARTAWGRGHTVTLATSRPDARTGEWEGRPGAATLVEQKAGKIKSSEPELWVRLVRAPKLIDRVRKPWGFAGILVKFKLEVGVGEDDLLRVAEASRRQSDAD